MQDLELAVLTDDLPEHGLKAGDLGTVVLAHRDGEGHGVEFATLAGETVAVVTLLASQARPIAQQESAHMRALAGQGAQGRLRGGARHSRERRPEPPAGTTRSAPVA